MGSRLTRQLYVLFCLSGFVGVLAEQVFEKMLSVVVGASTPSAAVVLAVYFLGLSLGGCCASFLIQRKVSPVLGYCLAELGVALCCLWLLASFNAGSHWYGQWIAWGASGAVRLVTARATIAGMIILPTALCLGLSFPFLGSMAAQMGENATHFLAKLYCTNLVGAALCALIAPFAIFSTIGLSGALAICIAVDGAVTLYAGWLARGSRDQALQTEQASMSQWAPGDSLILSIAFVSGLLFFALEVIWTHLVGVVIGTSVYAFSAMLFVVLLGLAAGAFQIARRAQRGAPPTRLNGLFFLCAAVILVQVVLWPWGPVGIVTLAKHAFGFYSSESIRLVVCLLLLLPAAYAFGLIYPSLFQSERLRERGSGRLIGYMTGVNALGCVLGAMIATFWLIPRVGSEWSLRWFTAALVLCGIAALALERRPLRDGWIAGGLLCLLAFGMPAWNRQLLTSGANVYLGHGAAVVSSAPESADPVSSELTFFHEHSYGGITTVVEYRHAHGATEHVLFTNGKFQGDDSEQREAQMAFALIPALHVSRRRDVLVVGCGTGETASVLNGLDYQNIDMAEISPGILDAAGSAFRHINEDVLRSPKVAVHLEDGRNYMLSRPGRTYDQITVEVSSIWFAGSTNLYSREFYELAKRHLRPKGMFQQWVQLHHIGRPEINSVIATLRGSFPYVSFWIYGGQGVVLASLEPQTIQPGAMEEALEYLRQHREASVHKSSAPEMMDSILASEVLDARAVDRLVHTYSATINTDWNRWIEFSTPRYNASAVDWFTLNRQYLASMAMPESSRR